MGVQGDDLGPHGYNVTRERRQMKPASCLTGLNRTTYDIQR